MYLSAVAIRGHKASTGSSGTGDTSGCEQLPTVGDLKLNAGPV